MLFQLSSSETSEANRPDTTFLTESGPSHSSLTSPGEIAMDSSHSSSISAGEAAVD